MPTPVDERETRIQQEAAALWRELHSQPPPVVAEATMLLNCILESLPSTTYDRLRSPYLRASTISRPPEA
jgi:hypothetical protein